MRTVAVLAAGGLVSWLLRVAFIVFVPAAWGPDRLGGVLRYAAPSAFAALVAAAVSSTATGDGALAGWRIVVAAAVTLLVARRWPHLLLALMTGAATATLVAAV